jgi:hypothetical protein
MKNVSFIFLFLGIFSLSCCEEIESILEAIAGCTEPNSFNYNAEATESNGSCLSMIGCLGYTPGYTNSGNIINTLRDPIWDQKTFEEVNIQKQFWGDIPVNFQIIEEPSPQMANAYASTSGEIVLGFHMFYNILNKYGTPLPTAGVIAHEFGHRAQQHIGFFYTRNEYQELEADAFSGFYMALAKQYSWAQINTYFDLVFSLGDFNFNSPKHHGTPQERLAAAYLGVTTAIYALQNGVQFSYHDLHQLFMSEISGNIAPRSLDEFKEVTYPDDLSEEYIQSLFPKIK